MRRLMIGLLAAFVLIASGNAVLASQQWQESNYKLAEALAAGYAVVSTYHNSDGHLVFVLQRQNVMLMCAYAVQQSTHCAQLGKEL
jgi:hypothetical protein